MPFSYEKLHKPVGRRFIVGQHLVPLIFSADKSQCFVSSMNNSKQAALELSFFLEPQHWPAG